LGIIIHYAATFQYEILEFEASAMRLVNQMLKFGERRLRRCDAGDGEHGLYDCLGWASFSS
jgi:hypothetical protein